MRLGETIYAGPKRQLEAAHVAETIRKSAEDRARLQAEFDAKRDAANLQPNMDALEDAKRVAGPNWTPDQEQQLLQARRKFGQASTMAGALGGAETAKGIRFGQGQTRMLAAEPAPGTPAYTQVYTATAGKPPDPTKELKSPEIFVYADPTGRQVSVASHDTVTNALTGKRIDQELPANFRLLGKASPVSVSAPGYGNKEKNAGDLQIANQQILAGQAPAEPLAALAQKLYDTNPELFEAGKDPFGGNVLVGFKKQSDNPGLRAIQNHLAREYFGKGQTAKVTDTATVPPPAGAATAQPGQNVLPGAGGSLLAPPSSGLGGGGQTPVQTQAIPAAQVPSAPLPSTGGAAPTTAGAPATAGQPFRWAPSDPGAIKQKPTAGGLSIVQATRGFDQQEATNFAKDPVVQQWRVTERGYNEMLRAAKYDTKYADLHLIYTMAKIFDPGSAVREGELALGQGAAPWASYLHGWWNYIKGGGRIDAKAREQILQQAYAATTSNFEFAVNLAQQTNDTLLRRDLDPRQHLPELVQPGRYDPKEINRYGAATYDGTTGDKQQDLELIKLAGNVQGGTPGQTSTTATGAPPAAPQSGTTRRGAAAVPSTPPAAAAATPPPTAAAPTAPPAAPARGGATRKPTDDDALFSAADAIVGRRR